MINFRKVIYLNILIIVYLTSVSSVNGFSISINNIGNTRLHLSYEDNIGEIVGFWIEKGENTVQLNTATRVTFDHLQTLYPFIFFQNGKLDVFVTAANELNFKIPNNHELMFYVLLERKTHILMSPFFGIKYNNKTSYQAILDEILKVHQLRLKLLADTPMSPKYREAYYEVIFARFVNELMAPYSILGYCSDYIPNTYRIRVDQEVNALLQLTSKSKYISLIKHYILPCIELKTNDKCIKNTRKQFDFVTNNFQGTLKEYLQFLILKEAELDKVNTSSLIQTFLKTTENIAFKSYFQHSEMMNKILNENKDEIYSLDEKSLTWRELMEFNKGKIIYIDVWASWCGPCRTELPHAISLEKKLDPAEINIIYISIDHELKKWVNAVNKDFRSLNLKQHYQINPSSQLAKLLTSDSVPKYIIVGKNGEIITMRTTSPSSPETLHNLRLLSSK